MVDTFSSGPDPLRRYRLLRKLGAGAMGEVHLAEDLTLGRRVALKFLVGENLTEADVARFLEEARSLGRLKHPHVVEVLDWGDEGGRPFIALELVEGESLRERLRREGVPPLDEALRWMDELCDAMAFAHEQGILHRDLKPANVLLDGEGRVKVVDFGLARRGDRREELTRTGMILGTPSYLAPECIRGGRASESSDLYAIAVMLFELLTGHLPFDRPTVVEVLRAHCVDTPPDPREFRSGLSEHLVEILLRTLSKRPEERVADVRSFRMALAAPGRAPQVAAARSEGIERTVALPLAPPTAPVREGAGATLGPVSRGRTEPLRPRATLRPGDREASRGFPRKGLLALLLGVAVVGAVAFLLRGGPSVGPGAAPPLRVASTWNGAEVLWEDRRGGGWNWSLLGESGDRILLQGRSGESAMHRVLLRSLRPGRRYRFRIEGGGRMGEEAFETARPRPKGRILALVFGSRLHLEYETEPSTALRLSARPLGSSRFVERSLDVPGRGPVDMAFPEGAVPIQGFLWNLSLGDEILATGRTRAGEALVDLPGAFESTGDRSVISQDPIWVGRHLVCASERGELVAFVPGERPAPVPLGRASVTRPLVREWILRPLGPAPSHVKARSALVALDDGTLLWFCRRFGTTEGFVRLVDLVARSRKETGRRSEEELRACVGAREWIVPWTEGGLVASDAVRVAGRVHFFTHGNGWALASFDVEARRFLRRVPLAQECFRGAHVDLRPPVVAGGRLFCFVREEIAEQPVRRYRFHLLTRSLGNGPPEPPVEVWDRFVSQAAQQRIEVGAEALWYCSAKELRRCALKPAAGEERVRRFPLFGSADAQWDRLASGPCLRRGDRTFFFVYRATGRQREATAIVASRWQGRIWSRADDGTISAASSLSWMEHAAEKQPWAVDLDDGGGWVTGVTRSQVLGGRSFDALRAMDVSLNSLRHVARRRDGLLVVGSRSTLWLVPPSVLFPSEAEKASHAQ